MSSNDQSLRPVNVLRDSGAELSLISKHDVPSHARFTGEIFLVDSFTGIAGLPICNVHLKSDLFQVIVRLGVVEVFCCPISPLEW